MRNLFLSLFGLSIFSFLSCSKGSELETPAIEKPIAHFSVNNLLSPDMAAEGRTLDITNDSKNAVTYHWDMARKTTSTLKVPEFSFLACGGPYKITLTVTNSAGETATHSEEYLVLCAGRTPTHSPAF